MKQKNIITVTLLSLTVIFAGCTSNTPLSPQENKELNNVSSTTINKNPGLMQNKLDGWLKDDWTPSVEKDPEIQKKYMKQSEVAKVKYIEEEDKPFTLQEYVDKAAAYQRANPSDESASHVKQMEHLPAIGK